MIKLKIMFMCAALFFVISQASAGFSGSFEPIPKSIQKQMIGTTWHKGCPMALNKLSYLTLNYWGFDNKIHQGHLIVNRMIAADTLDIFSQLFAQKFPIAKMQLASNYKAKNDWPSTEDNNTVAFFCRIDDQSPGKFSSHSYGIAVDINPVYNPGILSKTKSGLVVQPKKGKKYLDRQLAHPGMIGEKMAQLFAQHGWTWGKYFEHGKDYMHFTKLLNAHYMAKTLVYNPAGN